MTPEKILSVLEIYRKNFQKSSVVEIPFSRSRYVEAVEDIRNHCHSMISKTAQFANQDHLRKTFLRLGFIQGCFWVVKSYTLNELKHHNKPTLQDNSLTSHNSNTICAEKVLNSLNMYRECLLELNAEPIDFTHSKYVESSEDILGHCLGMIDKTIQFINEGRVDKAFRWLGFMQGCMWSQGLYTIDELSNHNKPLSD